MGDVGQIGVDLVGLLVTPIHAVGGVGPEQHDQRQQERERDICSMNGPYRRAPERAKRGRGWIKDRS